MYMVYINVYRMNVYCVICIVKKYGFQSEFRCAELCGIKELTSKIHLRWKPYLKVYDEVLNELYDLVVFKNRKCVKKTRMFYSNLDLYLPASPVPPNTRFFFFILF